MTRTATYLLPSITNYINIEKSNVINLYLGIKSKHPELNGNVFLEVKKILDELINNSFYINHYENIIEYKHPDQELYNNFINGLYSNISEDNKKLILKYFNLPRNHKVKKILYKDSFLRKQMEEELKVDLKGRELGEIINYSEELCEK